MTRQKNQEMEELKQLLRKTSKEKGVNIWKRVAEDLDKPTRNRINVNIYKLSSNTKKDETVIVPGKVLGMGELSHSVNVAAYSFSEEAMKKINTKGKALNIRDLVKNNPEGKKVRIIG